MGDGDRQYLSGLKVGGRRILVLVDGSASMLADDIVNAVRRQFLPEDKRRAARKWQQALRSVDWIVSQRPSGAAVQIYVFDTKARAALAGTDGTWLAGSDNASVDKALVSLHAVAPIGGTSLHAAFAVISAMNPRPDNVILITDGLPTQGRESPPVEDHLGEGAGARVRQRPRAAAPGHSGQRHSLSDGGGPDGLGLLLEGGHGHREVRS